MFVYGWNPCKIRKVVLCKHAWTVTDVPVIVPGMASLIKRSDSKYWIACFTDREGRRLKRSTKATNRREALKIAEGFEAVALRLTRARHVRVVMSDLHKSITGDDLVFPTVRAYLEGWLERKGPEVAKSTLAFYSHTVGAFIGYLGEDAEMPIDGVTLAHLTGFRNERLKQVSAMTVNHDLKGLRGIFKAAKREGVLIENPAEHLDAVRVSAGEKKSRRPFTLPELRAVLDVAGDEWRSMIIFGLYTGMRLADVARLSWANLDTVRGELRYVAGKTGKILILPLAGPLADHVAGLPVPKQKDGPLHPDAWKVLQETGKSGGLSNQFSALLAAAGLREAADKNKRGTGKGRDVAREAKGLSFHCLRHTAVSLLKEAGIPASVVQELVGHDSAQMSEHYTHTGIDALTLAAEAMPSLSKLGVAQ